MKKVTFISIGCILCDKKKIKQFCGPGPCRGLFPGLCLPSTITAGALAGQTPNLPTLLWAPVLLPPSCRLCSKPFLPRALCMLLRQPDVLFTLPPRSHQCNLLGAPSDLGLFSILLHLLPQHLDLWSSS